MYTSVAINGLVFEWDANKREKNLARHGLDLLLGAGLFDGRHAISYPSPRNGEHRVVTIARINDVTLALVWAERDGAVRLISLRRTRDAEKRLYNARFCH